MEQNKEGYMKGEVLFTIYEDVDRSFFDRKN